MRIELELTTREAQSLFRLLPVLSANRERIAEKAHEEYDRSGVEHYGYIWREAEEDARTLDKLLDTVFDAMQKGAND